MRHLICASSADKHMRELKITGRQLLCLLALAAYITLFGLAAWEWGLNGWTCSEDKVCWGHIGASCLAVWSGIIIFVGASFGVIALYDDNPTITIRNPFRRRIAKAEVVRRGTGRDSR